MERRCLLGPDNGGAPGGHAQGRREINWDSVPDQFAEPNALPGDFFNAPTAPRARGALLTTPGKHVAVSAAPHNRYGAAVRFADINPTYPSLFRTFGPPRLPHGLSFLGVLFPRAVVASSTATTPWVPTKAPTSTSR